MGNPPKEVAMLQLATLALSTPMLSAIIVGGVLVAGLFLYGVIKKFSRVSWVGWQIPIVFGVCLLVAKLIPLPEGTMGFVILAGTVFGVTALVLGVGAIIRSAMWRKKTRAHTAFRVFDRILGSITAILNFAVPLASFGGLVLWILHALSGGENMFRALYQTAIWDMVGPYLLDLSLVTFLLFALKGGYRLGIGRFLWLAFTIVLTFFAVFGSLYLVLSTPALSGFAHKLAGGLARLGDGAATLLGYTFATLILFLACFAVIVLLSVLINLIFKRVNRVRFLNVFSGCVMGTVFFLVALAVVLGLGIGVHQLAALGSGEGSILNIVGIYIARLEEAIVASPIAGRFYLFDPLSMLG